jgi:peptidoglycan hydrolase-like protein with peptidoglycan-binding domain
MLKPMRKLALGTASVLVIAIGCAATDYGADANNMTSATKMSPASLAADLSSPDKSFRKDDIRWAQVELRFRGLYHGSLDGVLGPETKRAVEQFQKNSGLDQTALLDAKTWEALTGNSEIGEGSSAPSDSDGVGSIRNSTESSDLGR